MLCLNQHNPFLLLLLLIGQVSAAALPAPPAAPLADVLGGDLQFFNATLAANSTEVQANSLQYRWYHGGTCNWADADADKGTIVWGSWSYCINKPDNSRWTSLEFDRPTYICDWCGKDCNGGGSRYSQPGPQITCMQTPSYCSELSSFVTYQPS